jgi:aconitate hydratase
VKFGILPLEFADPSEYDQVGSGDMLVLDDIYENIRRARLSIQNRNRSRLFEARHDLSARQVEVILAGSVINWVKNRS